MTFKELDAVVLVRDVPESGLRAGDLGAVVQVYSSEAFEVEFIKVAGGTQALLTLGANDDLASLRPWLCREENDLSPAASSGAAQPRTKRGLLNWNLLSEETYKRSPYFRLGGNRRD